ncbi:hypothetical protein EJB05_56768, partial [Eragrostis curvula]
MDVQVQRRFVIPAPPSQPPCEVPLTVFDLVAPTYHVTVLFAFSPPNPTNAALVAALEATLPCFPLLTARLVVERQRGRRGPFAVTGRGGGAGALVVEAAVPSAALADILPLAPSPDLVRLHGALEDAPAPQHVLRVQINRFACGGLVVASSASHRVADGYSMSVFHHAWADAVRRGAGAELVDHRPIVLPYGPGALAPRRPPRCEFQHRGPEFLPLAPATGDDDDAAGTNTTKASAVRVDPSEIANTLLHYTTDFVAKLKATAHNRYTTFETVTAHLWQKITAARGGAGAPPPTKTSLYVAVNGRGRLGGTDALPEQGFFGNLVLLAIAETTARSLTGGSLADAAALVRSSIRNLDKHYFQSFIDFGALHAGDGEEEEELEPAVVDEANVLSPDVDSDSWLHLDFHRLDFGCGGRLVGVLPGKIPQDGVVVLMPSLRKEGGVDAFVALWEKHAQRLSSIAFTLDSSMRTRAQEPTPHMAGRHPNLSIASNSIL